MSLRFAVSDTDRFENQLSAFLASEPSVKRLKEEVGQACQFVEQLFEKAIGRSLSQYGDEWTHFNNATSAICQITGILARQAAEQAEVQA